MAQIKHFRNGRIFTADPDQPWAASFAVEGQAITYVGDDDNFPGADVVDLEGAFVLPGFVDAHTHLIDMGASLNQLRLTDARDLAEIQRKLVSAAACRPGRIVGGGWLHSALDGHAPHRALIDDVVADIPVYLSANDLHTAWVNSAALDELGITADTPDPIGGRIERDADGQATGYLIETAALLTMRDFLAAQVTDADRDQALDSATSHYAADGVTCAVDMALDAEQMAAIERAADRLPIRVVGHWLVNRCATDAENLAQVDVAIEHSRRLAGDRLRIAGIKIIADGVIDSCTAAMKHPYSDGSNAEPIWDLAALTPVVVAADAARLQIAIHAIGDEASDIALDALEAAIAANGPRDRRHRIEHLETVTPENIARLARLGVVASMQPVHADPAIQENWQAMLGDDRIERGYPWKEVSESGAVLALGTDAPTAPHPPLPNMYVATTRKSALDPTLPANIAELALPLASALAHATRDAAFASRLDHVTGRLSVGMAADFVILDADPFVAGTESLLKARVLRTFVAGGEVYRGE